MFCYSRLQLPALLLCLLISLCNAVFGHITTSFDELNNDFELQSTAPNFRALQSDATGFFSNYLVSWSIPDLTENIVEMEMLLEVAIRSGTLSTFGSNLLSTDFGDVLDASATRDGVPLSGNLFISSSGFYRFTVNLSPAVTSGQTTTMRYKYNVSDTICTLDGKLGIAGTWASLITVQTNNIEYDFAVPFNVNDFTDGELTFKPKVDSFTQTFTSNSSKIFIAYDDNQLNFGDTVPKEVFFSFKPNLYTGPSSKCPRITQSFLFIYILAAIPAAACVCLILMAVIQRYTDDGRTTNTTLNNAVGLFRLNNFFPGSRDIVLSPTANVTTVRAVVEDEDEIEALDALVPITSINVDIDTDSPGLQNISQTEVEVEQEGTNAEAQQEETGTSEENNEETTRTKTQPDTTISL